MNARTVVGPQAPDKPDTRDMVIVHRIFRREFRQAADLALQAPAGDLRRAARIADHLELVMNLLHHHHNAEDEYLWPMLLERAGIRADLVHRMEQQHEGMTRHLANVHTLLVTWRGTGAASVAGELSATLRLLAKALVEHLDDEEQHILPLAQECMTVAEWEKLGEIAFATIPTRERFTVLGLLLAETSRAEAEKFMAMLPAIARFAWKAGARRGYAPPHQPAQHRPGARRRPALGWAHATATGRGTGRDQETTW